MPRKRTSFVVQMEGENYELFTVDENPADELHIILPPVAPSPTSTWHLIDHRYSVHLSADAFDGGFQVKETKQGSALETVKSFAYVKPNNGAAMLHIFTCLPGRIGLLPKGSEKKRKQIYTVFDYPGIGAIFYAVVVARSPLRESDLPPSLTIIRAPFRRYTLFVCAGEFGLSPLSSRLTLAVATMAPRYDAGEGILIRPDGAPEEPLSAEPHQISYVVEEQIDFLAEGAKPFYLQSTDPFGRPFPPEGLSGLDHYGKDPTWSVRTNRSQAREARLSHPPSGLWLPPEGAAALLLRPGGVEIG